MSKASIQVQDVWKKFRRGELHDSLRDLIPAVARSLVGRSTKTDALGRQEFWALREVSFEVRRGESLGIIGPNGAGKSTMLKVLSRILRPNKGGIHVEGRLSALIEVGAGFHQDLTGRENIYLNGAILGMTRKEIHAKEEAIIDFSGVEAFIETPVKRYSSGMKARLGFAVAAHLDPDVLLVDEVLSVGDAKFRSKCIRHMKQLIQSDVTVVFISHLLEQVRALCPRTIVLNKGEVIFSGDTSGAIKRYMAALSDDSTPGDDGSHDAELKRVVLLDEAGRETTRWQRGSPVIIELDYLVHRPLDAPHIQFNVSTVGGVYLGTTSSRVGGRQIPNQPGSYRMRFSLDVNALSDGDYLVTLEIMDPARARCVWATAQHYAISIRGTGPSGIIVRIENKWELLPTPSDDRALAAVRGQLAGGQS